MLYKDEYPEHLKHLYMAEEEKLKKEAWENRVNRTKLRKKEQVTKEENEDDEDVCGGSELTNSMPVAPEQTENSEKERWGGVWLLELKKKNKFFNNSGIISSTS